MSTIRELFQWGVSTLTSAEIENPELNTRLVIEHCFKFKPNTLQIQLNEKIASAGQVAAQHLVTSYINRRRQDEPLAYILESAYFCGKKYAVRAGTLIPRPETELLVDVVAQACQTHGWENAAIWDVGTGTGCIGIELAHRLPKAEIVLWEKSHDAATICIENLELHGLTNIRLIHGDFFTDNENRARLFPNRPLIIASNPPYIPIVDFGDLPATVRDFEPEPALNGGIDGLDYYRLLAGTIAPEFAPNALVVEVGIGQADAVSQLMSGSGQYAVECYRDLQHIDRVVSAIFAKAS